MYVGAGVRFENAQKVSYTLNALECNMLRLVGMST